MENPLLPRIGAIMTPNRLVRSIEIAEADRAIADWESQGWKLVDRETISPYELLVFDRKDDPLIDDDFSKPKADDFVASEAPWIVIDANPPTIIQYLELVSRAEVARNLAMVQEWCNGGMKTVIALPPEARLLQFIGGKWISVLPHFPGQVPKVLSLVTLRGERSHELQRVMADVGYDVVGVHCDPISDSESITFVQRKPSE